MEWSVKSTSPKILIAMWKSFKCMRRTGESGYMGFARVYENILTFLLEEPNNGDGEFYYDMVRRNQETFDTLYRCIVQKIAKLEAKLKQKKDSILTDPTTTTEKANPATTADCPEEDDDFCHIRLVEPRELLNLLNYIEVYNTRLLYAPRPFHCSNIFCMTSLVQMENCSVVACFFCGKQSAYNRSNDSVCFTTVSAVHTTSNTAMNNVTLNMYSVNTPGSVLYNNDLDPEDQDYRWTFFKEIEQLHHASCPIMWLNENRNAVWNYKEHPFTVRGVSKFHHLMQFLTTYPRPRENAAWLCLINRVSKCKAPGATQHTLDNLFSIVCHERLLQLSRDRQKRLHANVDRRRHPPRLHSITNDIDGSTHPVYVDYYSEPMHVNSYVYDVANLSDDASEFNGFQGLHLTDLISEPPPFGGIHTVLPLIEEEVISSTANTLHPYRTAHRPFDLQEDIAGDNLTEESVMDAFTDGTLAEIHYYRLLYLQGFLVPYEMKTQQTTTTDVPQQERQEQHVCLYCSAIFRNILGNFKNSKVYFRPQQVTRLIKYTLYGVKTKNSRRRYVYGRRLSPVRNFDAIFPSEVLGQNQYLTAATTNYDRYNARLTQALVWLSFSMDMLHADDCVFRIKKRSFKSSFCCICYDVNTDKNRKRMSCGHEICTSCYNEVFITDCCICKRGHRTELLTTSKTVINGYLERRSKLLQ